MRRRRVSPVSCSPTCRWGPIPAVEARVGRSALDRIRLVAPTTPDARLAAVVQGARGFLYLIGRLGVTGARRTWPGTSARSWPGCRRPPTLPVAVGFGISTPAQAARVARLADGVVVGSALVERVGRDGVAGGRGVPAVAADRRWTAPAGGPGEGPDACSTGTPASSRFGGSLVFLAALALDPTWLRPPAGHAPAARRRGPAARQPDLPHQVRLPDPDRRARAGGGGDGRRRVRWLLPSGSASS